jgi:hypothetical protein
MMVEGEGEGNPDIQKIGAAGDACQNHVGEREEGKDNHDGYPSQDQNASQSFPVHMISF